MTWCKTKKPSRRQKNRQRRDQSLQDKYVAGINQAWKALQLLEPRRRLGLLKRRADLRDAKIKLGRATTARLRAAESHAAAANKQQPVKPVIEPPTTASAA